MIDIRGDGYFVDVTSQTEWDPNANNYAGSNKIVVNINAGTALNQMQTDLFTLKTQIDSILQREEAEAKLREEWPALQDVYSQYQMVKNMLEDAKKPSKEEKDGSN